MRLLVTSSISVFVNHFSESQPTQPDTGTLRVSRDIREVRPEEKSDPVQPRPDRRLLRRVPLQLLHHPHGRLDILRLLQLHGDEPQLRSAVRDLSDQVPEQRGESQHLGIIDIILIYHQT